MIRITTRDAAIALASRKDARTLKWGLFSRQGGAADLVVYRIMCRYAGLNTHYVYQAIPGKWSKPPHPDSRSGFLSASNAITTLKAAMARYHQQQQETTHRAT